LVLFEALAHGKPVIAAARGCIACDHAETESLVAPAGSDFVEAASGWLGRLSREPGALARAQTAALARARRMHQAAVEAPDILFAQTLVTDLSVQPRLARGAGR
jgi:hypothetical protein